MVNFKNVKEYKTKLLHYQIFCHQSRQHYFYHRNFDVYKISPFSSNCPFDKKSIGKLPVGQARCLSTKCPATSFMGIHFLCYKSCLADLTVSKMPGTSNIINSKEIHFAFSNHLITLLFLYETR